jgi:hypothetical protein
MSKILIAILALALLGVVAVSGCTTTPVTNINLTDAKNTNSEMTILEINGTTDPGATVTVNGAQATVDSNGKYTYNLTGIVTGDTKVNITAKASNKNPATIIMTVTRTVTESSDGVTLYELKWYWNGTVTT